MRANEAMSLRVSSVVFEQGTEIHITDSAKVVQVHEWLAKRNVFDLDFSLIGAETPLCKIEILRKGHSVKSVLIFVTDEKDRARGTISKLEASELFSRLGFRKLCSLWTAYPNNEPSK